MLAGGLHVSAHVAERLLKRGITKDFSFKQIRIHRESAQYCSKHNDWRIITPKVTYHIGSHHINGVHAGYQIITAYPTDPTKRDESKHSWSNTPVELISRILSEKHVLV